MKDPRSILITGASSGIGEALAMAYAGPGVNLALTGRDASRLEAVAAACRQREAAVHAKIIDVADRATMAGWIEEIDRAAPIDLVIANAGIGVGTTGGFETEEQTRSVFGVNVGGAFNTVLPLIPKLAARATRPDRAGELAGVVPRLPGVADLLRQQGGAARLGEGLRGDLQPYGVEVSVICPGFVESRIAARNEFPMPFLMSAGRAAAIVKRGLARNRARIAFPFPMYFAIWLLGTLPPLLTDPLLMRLAKKEQQAPSHARPPSPSPASRARGHRQRSCSGRVPSTAKRERVRVIGARISVRSVDRIVLSVGAVAHRSSDGCARKRSGMFAMATVREWRRGRWRGRLS